MSNRAQSSQSTNRGGGCGTPIGVSIVLGLLIGFWYIRVADAIRHLILNDRSLIVRVAAGDSAAADAASATLAEGPPEVGAGERAVPVSFWWWNGSAARRTGRMLETPQGPRSPRTTPPRRRSGCRPCRAGIALRNRLRPPTADDGLTPSLLAELIALQPGSVGTVGRQSVRMIEISLLAPDDARQLDATLGALRREAELTAVRGRLRMRMAEQFSQARRLVARTVSGRD